MNAWVYRLAAEWDDLRDKIDKLRKYVLSDHFKTLSDEDKSDLKEQLVHMQRYYAVLTARVSRHVPDESDGDEPWHQLR